MIAWIALGFSVISLLLWVVFALSIRRLFKRLYPMLQSFGIMGSQNLQKTPIYDIIGEPDEFGNAETDK